MKTIATSFAVFLTLLLLASCSNDDMPSPQPPLPTVVLENTATDAMMQRDSISKEEDIDPPLKPKP